MLKAIDFGSDVAESDANLPTYFVATDTFQELTHDRCDLVLGTKGTGKSAIYHYLLDPDEPIPALRDVDVVPASNTAGSVIFRRLDRTLTIEQRDEQYYRLLWLYYATATVANHVATVYDGANEVRTELKRLGLDLSTVTPENGWSLAKKLVQRFRTGKVSGSLGPKAASLEAEANFQATSDEEVVELEHLLRLVDESLTQNRRRLWLLFDRLDEAFSDREADERPALRGLLRAHLDLAAYSERLRLKIFLRNDVYDRITQLKGFVNLTHLRRHTISWPAVSVMNLIASRVCANANVRKVFSIPEAPRDHKTQERACLALFPETVGGVPYRQWILDVTTDATREPNPRNVVTLLNEGRKAQIREDRARKRSWDRSQPLITRTAWLEAAAATSRRRLEDTILAEANHLRPYIDKMSGGPYRYTTAQLAQAFDQEPGTPGFRAIVDSFKYWGVMAEVVRDLYEVPVLYRNSLKLTRPRYRGGAANYGLPNSRVRFLEDVARTAATAIEAGSPEYVTDHYTTIERRFLHEQIAEISDLVGTESFDERVDGTKAIRAVPLTRKFDFPDADLATGDDTFTALVEPDVLAELESILAGATDHVQRQARGSLYLTEPLHHENANLLAALARERADANASEHPVRCVGMVVDKQGGRERRRCIIAVDLAGASPADQAAALAQSPGRERFAHYMNWIIEHARTKNVRIETRPMAGPMLTSALRMVALSGLDFELRGKGMQRIAVWKPPAQEQ